MKFGILDYLTEQSVEQGVIQSAGDVICYQCSDASQLPDDISTLTSVMVWHYLHIDRKVIDHLTSCRAIVRVGVGIDNVDLEYAGRMGIPVVHIPDYGTNDVADHAFGLLLSAMRKIHFYDRAIQRDVVGGWNPNIPLQVFRLSGKTLGIIGFGRIGMAMATRAKAFDMDTIFYDPYKSDGYDKVLQVKRVDSLVDLVSQADVISIHAPLTAETKGLINADLLKHAKPDLTLINTARGEIVSIDAVYACLQNGTMANFVADVLEQEPPNPNHPLLQAYQRQEPWLTGRVVLTPHAGFYAEETRWEMRYKAAKQMLHAAMGEELVNCVNYRWLENPRTPINRSRVSGS